jgi:hypothetical protein
LEGGGGGGGGGGDATKRRKEEGITGFEGFILFLKSFICANHTFIFISNNENKQLYTSFV